MKRNTKKRAKLLDQEIARILRGMRGAASQIAEIAGVSRAHVSRVLNLKKPPSIKILLAIDCVLSGAKRRINGAILHRAHPEIDPESQIPNSEERAGGRA